jgi:opacity protein-like surface antigen
MRIRSIAPRFGLAALAAAGLALPAFAADYPVLRGSQVEDAPPPPSSFSWDGFYFGGGAGVSDSGATFFGFAGQNWSFGDVVLGFEADYTRSGHAYMFGDFIGRRAITSNGTVNDFSLTTNQGAKLNDYATARLRMGWAYGSFMPFATIGGAVGRFNTLSTVTAANFITQVNPLTGAVYQGQAAGYPLVVGAAKKNVYGFGMAVGGGLDWALADNMFLRGEYQHIRFADIEGTTTTVNAGRAALGVKF